MGRSHSPGSRERFAAEPAMVGAAADNKRRPFPPIVRESFVTPAAVIREARQGCCVMLEAQLAESGNSRERASAGSMRVSEGRGILILHIHEEHSAVLAPWGVSKGKGRPGPCFRGGGRLDVDIGSH